MAPFGDEVHVGPEIEDIYYIAQGFRSIFFDQHFFLLIRLTRPLGYSFDENTKTRSGGCVKTATNNQNLLRNVLR